MNTQRIINAAQDCMAQFFARRYPLKNVARDIIALRHLNSRERRALLDLVFRTSRELFLFEHFLAAKVRFSSGMSSHDKSSLLLHLFAVDHALLEGSADQRTMLQDFKAYGLSLGDARALNALSPFIRDHLIKDYGDEAKKIAQGITSRSAKYLAVDHTLIALNDVKNALTDHNINYFCHPRIPSALGIHDEIDLTRLPPAIKNAVWFMDAGSQIIAELIKPQPGDRVLDMCAGEGNKARYITMQPCHYVAADVDAKRLDKAKTRLTNKNVEFVVGDARTSFHKEKFDWILLDAPCSGTGVLRRHPDLALRLNQAMLDESVQLQRELADCAINLLKPEGILVYATCSLFHCENGQQIEGVLRRNSSVMAYPLKDLVGERIKLDNLALDNNSFTLFPHLDDCDGFFIATIKKVRG